MRKFLAVAFCVVMLVVLGCQQGQSVSAKPEQKACACKQCPGCGKAASKPAGKHAASKPASKPAASKPASKPAAKTGCGCGCGM